MVRTTTGLKPAAFILTGRRSNQLNYASANLDQQRTVETLGSVPSRLVFTDGAMRPLLVTAKQEVIPSNPSGNRLLAQVVKKGSCAAAASE